MTKIVEKRRDVDVIAGFLGVVFALAAFRGATGAPILSAAFAIGALVTLIAWVSWRRKPALFLSISPEEIVYGRIDWRGTGIPRTASGRLRFQQGFRDSGWFLVLADEPDAPGISMIGFDMDEVARACVQHGWTVG